MYNRITVPCFGNVVAFFLSYSKKNVHVKFHFKKCQVILSLNARLTRYFLPHRRVDQVEPDRLLEFVESDQRTPVHPNGST